MFIDHICARNNKSRNSIRLRVISIILQNNVRHVLHEDARIRANFPRASLGACIYVHPHRSLRKFIRDPSRPALLRCCRDIQCSSRDTRTVPPVRMSPVPFCASRKRGSLRSEKHARIFLTLFRSLNFDSLMNGTTILTHSTHARMLHNILCCVCLSI